MRLSLPQVTLVAVDTRTPVLAAESLLRSMAQVDFGAVLLFTGGWLPKRVVPGLQVVQIDPIRSGAEYSQFVLRRLPAHIRSSHVLVTQWDGFVLDASAWRNEFLAYDYVGSVWHDQPRGRNVGNGGFSLRSRRLLAAGTDLRIMQEHPEDEALCRTHRNLLEQMHGVRFAPATLARHFSYENESPAGPTFGFHGPFNLPRVLDEATLQRWLALMPDDFYVGRDGRRLARALLAQRMPLTAQQVLQRRRAAGVVKLNSRVLELAAALMGRLARPGAGQAP